jgi:hypothetical protein
MARLTQMRATTLDLIDDLPLAKSIDHDAPASA